jgi:hypothetical protein
MKIDKNDVGPVILPAPAVNRESHRSKFPPPLQFGRDESGVVDHMMRWQSPRQVASRYTKVTILAI